MPALDTTPFVDLTGHDVDAQTIIEGALARPSLPTPGRIKITTT